MMTTPVHSSINGITNNYSKLFISYEAKCADTMRNIIINILKKQGYEEKEFNLMFEEINILNEYNMPKIIDSIFYFTNASKQKDSLLKEDSTIHPVVKKLLKEFNINRSPSFKREQDSAKKIINNNYNEVTILTKNNWDKKWKQYVRKNARNSCLYNKVYFVSKGYYTIPWNIIEDIEEVLPCLRMPILKK